MTKVCLVGNPNSGKSTLFNLLTKLNQKVGNYPGVTVDREVGSFHVDDQSLSLVDLPGTYSIYPNTIDETIVYNILRNNEDEDHPDVVVLVLNSGQLRRSLILTSQVVDMGLPCVVALNMIDEMQRSGQYVNADVLSKELGVPVIPISATKQVGINELKAAIKEQATAQRTLRKPLVQIEDDSVYTAIRSITDEENDYRAFLDLTMAEKSRNIAAADRIKLLELRSGFEMTSAKNMAKDITARYGFINQIAPRVITSSEKGSTTLSTTEKIDKVLTNRFIGLPLALLVLFLVFQAIFSVASPPMDWIEDGIGMIGSWIRSTFPESWIVDLAVDGVLAGLAGVLVFIPQIAILFGLLAILEGTGYMARISYMMDRAMRKFGLSGKAVVPMMSGFACAIPAVMATRNIKSWKERLITIMVTPLLSCSARLPVYILLIGLMVPPKPVLGFLNMQGLTMMGFYLLGLVMAMLIAGIMSKLLNIEEKSHFIMEMPKYRWPQWRNVLLTMYQKARIFAVEAGKIILVISIALWFLASYGPQKRMAAIDQKYEQLADNNALSADWEQELASEKLTNSYAGIFGKTIEPVIEPLGFDWKIGIALLTSFAAREVFVGTMSTIYSVEADEDNPKYLRDRLRDEINPDTGKPVYSVATVMSLLLFYAFAMQCMATLAVVKRETKSWKWPIIQLIYLTVLAYLSSLIAFQLLS